MYVTSRVSSLNFMWCKFSQVADSIRINIEDNLENELALCIEDYKKCKITGEYITQVEDLAPLVDDLDYFMDILFRDSLYVKRIYSRSYNPQIWSRIFVPVHDCLVSGGYTRGSKWSFILKLWIVYVFIPF